MTAGDIYTIAGNGTSGFSGDEKAATSAELNRPVAVAFDASGNMAIADSQNQRIRFVSAEKATQFGQAMTAGDIYTIAGNGKNEYSGEGVAATGGGLQQPMGVAFDPSGGLAIAETNGARVRFVAKTGSGFFGKVMAANDIYTIAGDGTFGFSGDTMLATGAQIAAPQDISIDAGGNLVIADTDRQSRAL